MNKLMQNVSKKLNYPKVLWYWLGGMIAIIVMIALYANFSTIQNQLSIEWAEHVSGTFPQTSFAPMPAPGQAQIPVTVQPPNALSAQANVQAAFNPGVMEGTYNQIADSMSKITVSIYSDIGPQTPPQLLGSGMIIGNQCVLTNYHIVKGRINLFISTGTPSAASYPVRLDRADQNNDLALLGVTGNGTFPVYGQIGDSDAVHAGDIVFAMGNAFGNGNFFTSGMIQDAGVFYDANQQVRNSLFMTNINIYPGFCGSPLMNMQGEIIGINNSVNCQSGIGIGQATPVNRALPLLRGGQQLQNLPMPRMAPMPSIPLGTPLDSNPYSLA